MIKQKPQTNGIEIDLTGPQGNAYSLMGTAKRIGKQITNQIELRDIAHQEGNQEIFMYSNKILAVLLLQFLSNRAGDVRILPRLL